MIAALIMLAILVFCIWVLVQKAKRYFSAQKIGKDVVQEYINEKGITITKRLDVSFNGGKRIFFIDDKNKRIHDLRISPDDANPVRDFTYEYSDIIKCEVIKDELTADNYNDLVRYEDTEEKGVRKFGFRITVNSISSPYIDIITDKGKAELYKSDIAEVTDWVNVINIAIQQGKKLAENR